MVAALTSPPRPWSGIAVISTDAVTSPPRITEKTVSMRASRTFASVARGVRPLLQRRARVQEQVVGDDSRADQREHHEQPGRAECAAPGPPRPAPAGWGQSARPRRRTPRSSSRPDRSGRSGWSCTCRTAAAPRRVAPISSYPDVGMQSGEEVEARARRRAGCRPGTPRCPAGCRPPRAASACAGDPGVAMLARDRLSEARAVRRGRPGPPCPGARWWPPPQRRSSRGGPRRSSAPAVLAVTMVPGPMKAAETSNPGPSLELGHARDCPGGRRALARAGRRFIAAPNAARGRLLRVYPVVQQPVRSAQEVQLHGQPSHCPRSRPAVSARADGDSGRGATGRAYGVPKRTTSWIAKACRSFVERAEDYVEEQRLRTPRGVYAFADMEFRPMGEWNDGPIYIFILTTDGEIHFHGASMAREGTEPVQRSPDNNGVQFTKRSHRRRRPWAAGSSITCSTIRTSRVTRKTARPRWATPKELNFDDGKFVIGSGFYPATDVPVAPPLAYLILAALLDRRRVPAHAGGGSPPAAPRPASTGFVVS